MKYFPRMISGVLVFVLLLWGPGLLAQNIKVTRRVMTDEEFNRLKSRYGVYNPAKNYNVIINGHGTGLKPPTEEQWEKMRYKPIMADTIESLLTSDPPAVDNSDTPWFPPIGNQDGEGSCTAWALAYYTKTFQEAKEHNWDLSECSWEGGYYGAPSEAFQGMIFSPDFVYHLINEGRDRGSWFDDAVGLMEKIGAASWTNMPYDPKDSRSWPSEDAWREAPLYRNDIYSHMEIYTTDGIEDLKILIAGGNLATIGIDANEYSELSSNDLWTADDYTSTSVNHANTIVGYDDNFGPYTEGGVPNQYGAFKVANSWGVGTWENDEYEPYDGFYWITPGCLMEDIEWAHCYINIPGYNPEMIAVFDISHERRGEVEIAVDMDPSSTSRTKNFYDYVLGGTGNLPFPNNKIVMDITEFVADRHTGSEFMMSVYDGLSKFTGKVKSFAIETYVDYPSGAVEYKSPDENVETENRETVFVLVVYSGGLF